MSVVKVGVLSDIHGNLHALDAALHDMQKQGVQTVLFLGDLLGEFPFPAEVIARLRALPDYRAVRGNRERFIQRLEGQDRVGWTDEQFAPMYWSYHAVTPEMRAWMAALPDTLPVYFDGLPPLYLAHEVDRHFGETAADAITSVRCTARMEQEPDPHQALMAHVEALLSADERMRYVLDAAPDGMYLFGHVHLQWNWSRENKTLMNPGSCGMPLDLAPGAAYALLTGEQGRWCTEYRRVSYDIPAAMAALRASTLYSASRVYSLAVLAQLRTARFHWMDFLQEVQEYAKNTGQEQTPIGNEIWQRAAEDWIARQDDRFRLGV